MTSSLGLCPYGPHFTFHLSPFPAPYAAKFGNLGVRLKYTGDGDAPGRNYIAEELILQTMWINGVARWRSG